MANQTTLQLVTVDDYKRYASRSILVKEFNKKLTIDHIPQWPSLVKYKVSVGRDQWVTSGFLLARYGPFDLFTHIASEVFTRPVSSDDYDLLFALASSESVVALERLVYFFKAFTMFDLNKLDRFNRTVLYYVRRRNVFCLLLQRGCLFNNSSNPMSPYQYMAVMGNSVVFSLTKDYGPLLNAISEHGAAAPLPFLKFMCQRPIRSSERVNRSILVYLGTLHLFTVKALRVFEYANRHHGAQVPLDDERQLYSYCYEFLKTRHPGRQALVLGSLRRRLLGGPVTDEFRHFAYLKLVHLVLCEAPLDNYDLGYGHALCRDATEHCLMCSESERLEIARLMVDTEVPHLAWKMDWITEWIFVAYKEAGRENYLPVIYKLSKMVGEDGQTALHKICGGGRYTSYNFDFFKAVVDMGGDLDVRDSDGCTALLLLLRSYRGIIMKGQMVKLLLERGAHVDIPDAKRKMATEKMLSNELNVNIVPRLQCICAKVLQKKGKIKKTLKTLPDHIKQFIMQH